MFLTKEAVRLATEGFAQAVICDGCPAGRSGAAVRQGRRPVPGLPDLHEDPQLRPVRVDG
jgi:hypothetical protein